MGETTHYPVYLLKETKGESTTQNITLKFLKYLFLYIKSGRRTFNYHDITPLVIREYQEKMGGGIKTRKERDKSRAEDGGGKRMSCRY